MREKSGEMTWHLGKTTEWGQRDEDQSSRCCLVSSAVLASRGCLLMNTANIVGRIFFSFLMALISLNIADWVLRHTFDCNSNRAMIQFFLICRNVFLQSLLLSYQSLYFSFSFVIVETDLSFDLNIFISQN